MKILLTGAAGFIGHHVSERLLARGDEVGLCVLELIYGSNTRQRDLDDG